MTAGDIELKKVLVNENDGHAYGESYEDTFVKDGSNGEKKDIAAEYVDSWLLLKFILMIIFDRPETRSKGKKQPAGRKLKFFEIVSERFSLFIEQNHRRSARSINSPIHSIFFWWLLAHWGV